MNACLLFICFSLSQPGQTRAEPFFGEDKLKHFFTSFAVTALSASGVRALGVDHDTSLLIGMGTAAALGVGKELRDRNDVRASASLLDLTWDAAGIGAAAVIVDRAQ